jgi:6-phosphogluconolactonase/glucosamine-6-phosphate isomerase/deaminase/LmbE family N-acetylglucosaminyl deacetylase
MAFLRHQQMFLLTAPHPDDDIVGLGDFIQQLPAEKVTVWFMTDGNDPKRKQEAEAALASLGISTIVWSTLPFYRKTSRAWDAVDVDMAKRILDQIQPTQVGVCFDADPHLTHVACFRILQQALTFPCFVYLYHSAWAKATVYPPSLPSPTYWEVRRKAVKKAAVECHQSQLELAVHDGNSSRLLDRANLHEEVFYKVTTDAFRALPAPLPSLKRRTVTVPDVCQHVFDTFVRPLKAGSRVIFPTGNTPLDLYRRMREASLPSYHVYQLDKYLFSTEYRDYLARELPDHMTFHFFDAPHQHDKRCQQVDLCILGIGQNGHIAFNEPPSDATSQTRVVELSPSTIESNAPPSNYALTLGIETILTAKQIVLMAKRNKQGVLKRVYRGESLPATCLAHHPNVTFVVER